MVNAVIIDKRDEELHCLERLIINSCPEINISNKAYSLDEIHSNLGESNPELIFVDIDNMRDGEIELVDKFISADFEVIFVTNTPDHALDALKYGVAGYIIRPVRKAELVRTVSHAIQKINRKVEHNRNKNLLEKLTRQNGNEHMLGVPTLEGFEFVVIGDIIRCEGLQKCTRIITLDKTDLISSYNLGEFRKLLEPYGFFSPHKSHLINIRFIRKYNREGSIIMLNGSYVPVAKRRKKDFMNQFTHF
jgi:two-component system, LytTR family, response regulator